MNTKDVAYFETSKLPAPLAHALKALGYHKRDVRVEADTVATLEHSSYGQGCRGYTMIVNLETGEHRTAYGDWGGSNFCHANPMDSGNETPINLVPGKVAVIQGQDGYMKTATIIVHPETLAPMLPPSDELDARAQRLLNVYCSYKPSYRRPELCDGYRGLDAQSPLSKPFTAAEITEVEDRLVSSGHLSRNKAGSVSVTTKGKNARKR